MISKTKILFLIQALFLCAVPAKASQSLRIESISGTTEIDVQQQNTVDMFIKTEPAASVATILMTFRGTHPDNYGEINLWDFGGLATDQSGRYHLQTTLSPVMENDEYRLSSLTIANDAEQTADISISRDDNLIPGTNLSVPKIKLKGGASNLGALFREISLDKTEYKPGETIQVKLTIDPDSSKLWLVILDFRLQSDPRTSIIDGGSPDAENLLKFRIPMDAKPGTYYLSMVSGTDEGNKHSSLRALSDSIYFFNSGIPVPHFKIVGSNL